MEAPVPLTLRELISSMIRWTNTKLTETSSKVLTILRFSALCSIKIRSLDTMDGGQRLLRKKLLLMTCQTSSSQHKAFKLCSMVKKDIISENN
jgi:hypothetical protein